VEGWDLPDEYQLVKQLGKGGYGYVFEAVHIPTGKRVAIKRMDEVFCNRSHARRILREIAILRRLKSSYVVDIVDIIEPKNPETFQEIYIVLELADKDMKKLIESNTYLTLEGV
jgi:mitogen-activated protein kinase 1/3